MPERPSDEWIEAANCLASVARTLASAVHEANNMLQVIAGSAEMIQMQGQLPDGVLRRTAIIAEHAQRVSALLGTVRDLSKFPPRRRGDQTNLVSVVNGALDMRRHALNRGHITVTIDAGDRPPIALASWRPTMQLVLNLIMNAEQAAAGRAGAAVAIRVHHGEEHVQLSVSDNGAGFDPAAVEPFMVKECDEAAPLLGLGLTAARWLAEREGGSLTVESGADGTTAVLTLGAA